MGNFIGYTFSMNKTLAIGLCLVVGSSGYSADSFSREALSPPVCASHKYLVKSALVLFVLASAVVRAEPPVQSNRAQPLSFADQIMMQKNNPKALHKLLVDFGQKNLLPVKVSDDNAVLVQKMLLAAAPDTRATLVVCVRFVRVPNRITETLLNDRSPRVRLAAADAVQYLHDPEFVPAVQKRLRVEAYNLILSSLAVSAIDLQGRQFVDSLISASAGKRSAGLSKQHATDILMFLQDTKYDEIVIAELLKSQDNGGLLARMDQDKVNRIKGTPQRQWLWFLLPFSLPLAYGLKRRLKGAV